MNVPLIRVVELLSACRTDDPVIPIAWRYQSVYGRLPGRRPDHFDWSGLTSKAIALRRLTGHVHERPEKANLRPSGALSLAATNCMSR